MSVVSVVLRYACAVREFIVPSYRPERYYMRGPGPACAKRGDVTIGRGAAFH